MFPFLCLFEQKKMPLLGEGGHVVFRAEEVKVHHSLSPCKSVLPPRAWHEYYIVFMRNCDIVRIETQPYKCKHDIFRLLGESPCKLPLTADVTHNPVVCILLFTSSCDLLKIDLIVKGHYLLFFILLFGT